MIRKRGSFRSYHILNYSDNRLLIIFIFLMAAIVVEQSYSQVADFVSDQIASFWGIVLFVITSSIYLFGSFVILEMIKAKNRESGLTSMRMVEFIITIIQYILSSIIVIVVLQVLFSSQYNRDLLTATYNISYLSSIFLTVILAWKLFSWYKIQKKPIVLLYGLGAVFIVLNLISSIVWTDAILLQKPSVVFPDSEVIFGISNDAGNGSGGPFDFFLSSLYYFQFAYVLLISGGTVLLLYHNFKRIGKIKFWVLVSLPTLIFLSTTLTIYQQINPTGLVAQATPIDYMIPILLMNYSALAVGVVFGLSFILVGRFLKQGIHSRDYMLIAGLGFILFLWANGATLIQTAYPPYGIATVSAVPLSLFMILYGLSYSAISVAQDETLRRSIRKNVKDMKFLDSIGSAQMEKEFEKKVLDITKKSSELMIDESGVQPSLSEDDMKHYLQQVLQEVKADKT